MRKSVLALALIAFAAPQMAPTGTALPQTAATEKAARAAAAASGGVYEQLNLFGEAFERIRNDAVEPVGDGKLVRTAISGMLAGLDPHSVYLTESRIQGAADRRRRRTAPSTGLVLTLDNSHAKVVSPRDGSPAAAADIKPGDMIFSIDKDPTYDMTLPEIEQKLRGPAGSEVALMVRRGSDKPLEVKLKRAAPANFPTVDHAARIRRYRLYPAGRLRRRDARRARRRGQGFAAAGRQQADRLHRRSAQQPRRQLRRRR